MSYFAFWVLDMSNAANSPQQSDAVILARLDERTHAMSKQLEDVKRGQVDMSARMDKLTDEVDAKLATHGDGYVTKDEFAPVKALAYGFAGLILVAVVIALVALVVKGGTP
jgi:hypothetical protein